MASYFVESFALMVVVCVGTVLAQSKVEQSEDGSSGSLKFSMPDLNDDEAHSPWVPDQLKCDACMAVSYQLWNAFDKFNKKHKYKKYKLLESDLIDITDELCSNQEIFNSYGIKEINKVHHLSGPGIPGADAPGVIAGGGKWPYRLRDMCDQFMGVVGEDKIYEIYRKDVSEQRHLEDYLCRGPASSVRGECTQVSEHKGAGRHSDAGHRDDAGHPDDDDIDGLDMDRDEL